MEVLPCSDVQYVGETNCAQRSSGIKTSDDIHDETKATLLPIDCSHQMSGDNLLLAKNKEESTYLVVDHGNVNPGHDQSNVQPVPRDELSNVTHSGEGTLQKINGSKHCLENEPLNDTHDTNIGIQGVYSPQLSESYLSNGTHEGGKTFTKEEEMDKEVDGKVGRWELSYSNFPCNVKDHNCLEQGQMQLPHNINRMDEILLPSGGIARNDLSPTSETIYNEILDSQHKEGKGLQTDFHKPSENDPKRGNSDDQNQNGEPLSVFRNSCQQYQVETELLNGKLEGEVSLLEDDYQEEDRTVALWVKWQGKWQTGIRCSRADWPLSSVKEKPTHGRKKYILVFFPHSRTHCWTDTLLICAIKELPEPLAFGTHYNGLEMVKDLAVPRFYIMQKLAVEMLNVGDQLHIVAVTEIARRVTAWREFAVEAFQCECYSDLGRMLVKLHSMILPTYIDSNWLENSFHYWRKCCQEAQSAECIETLKEELVDAVLWNEVEALWDAPMQPDLGSEWKTWKQEVIKWLSTSHPMVFVGDAEQQNCDDSTNACLRINSRKRPKLEVRRAEMHVPQVDPNGHDFLSQPSGLGTKMQNFNCQAIEDSMPGSGSCKEEFTSSAVQTEDLGQVADKWYDIVVVEAANPEFLRTKEEARTAVEIGSTMKLALDAQHGSHSANRYRQCMAFIEAKGRQCGRWANDGDVYCCVHLSHRFVEKASDLEQTPPPTDNICEGMTNLGARCKHRSKTGSSFCKKHQIQGNQNLMDTKKPAVSSGNGLKRKFETSPSSEIVGGKEIVLVGEDQNVIQDNTSLLTGEEALDGRNSLQERTELLGVPLTPESYNQELVNCIVQCPQTNEQCLDRVRLHSLYCEKHLPAWLKRARHGKSRIISKDIFIDLLNNCDSRKQKVHLHQACELLYRFMKSALSRRNTVSKETLIGWVLSEASKDFSVVESLWKVVSHEREKIGRLWGFDTTDFMKISSSGSGQMPAPEVNKSSHSTWSAVKCKICMEEYPDDNSLGIHWMHVHKREAQWLFRGFACAICLNSFTNRKVLEQHGKERHSLQSLDQCILFQCMPCGSHFVNPEQLWLHVLTLHAADFRLPTISQQNNCYINQGAQLKPVLGTKPSLNNGILENHSDSMDGSRRFVCKLCGLKFDLLPDLGRHHQVAHMGPNSLNMPLKKQNHFNGPKLKPGRRGRPRIRNSTGLILKKDFQPSNPVSYTDLRLQSQASEVVGLEQSVESHCSDVAEILFPELQKTKPRPSNLEILSVAQSTCCKVSLQAALEEKYGVLPERLYLRAAKLCSELNIRVEWHLEGFLCPKGCRPTNHSYPLAPLLPQSDRSAKSPSASSTDLVNGEEWEMEECHCILNSTHLKQKLMRKATVLCSDLSFGRESVPVPCVSMDVLSSSTVGSMPWESFTYVTERLLDQSLGLDTESSQLGCACPHSTCSAEKCDHVYLFNNDYENAKDINGESMQGKFSYDENGRIILQEGCLVYECNSMCSCDKTCLNRVLQKGVQVKLEVFKTEKGGWAVRAGEAIDRGTFVCEYVGELLSYQEANQRSKRYGNDSDSYVYEIDTQNEDTDGMNEGTLPYVIDATKYGNVSRFINHCCSSNLVSYQVLVESMDCQLAHIGFYASRDIAIREELVYNYRYRLLGRERPCYCGASNCQGQPK